MHRCQLFCHNQGIYLNEYGSSCQIETTPLICSTNQWTGFCTIGTSVMEDSRRSLCTYTESLFLHVVKHNLFVFFFFYLAFASRIFTIHRTAGEGGGYLLIFILPISSASQALRHYLDYCCRELTSAHSWQPESKKRFILSVVLERTVRFLITADVVLE